MDFAFSAAEEAFRGELRGWLKRELPLHRAEWPATDDEFTLHPDRSFDACLAWHKRLHRGGWVGIAWPRDYGGRGASLVEQMVFQEEMVRAGAPPGVNTIGPDSGETSRTQYNAQDDYSGYTDGYGTSTATITDLAGNSYPTAYQTFTRSVTMTATSYTPSGWGRTINGLLVKVTVSRNGQAVATIEQFVSP